MREYVLLGLDLLVAGDVLLVYLYQLLEDFLVELVLNQLSLHDGVGLEVHVVLDGLVDVVDLLRLPRQLFFFGDLHFLLFVQVLEDLVDCEEDLPEDTFDESSDDVDYCDVEEAEEKHNEDEVIRGAIGVIESYL